MGIDICFVALLLLAAFAAFDLIVGVSNDAVNFLNSSFGSKAGSRFWIMIIASLGIMAGVMFSSGMMEVARKGIFNPEFFTMPELLVIFLAVMITDIILLDLFNTYGLPTSTTVSIVFELLGAAVAVSVIKVYQSVGGLPENVLEYINSSNAIRIIGGILLSVIVAFAFGAIVQVLSRLVFTFDIGKRIRRYGAIWGGVAMASLTFFILVKGAKGFPPLKPYQPSFMENWYWIYLGVFAISAVLLQILIVCKVNILKPIVLVGTFALAMAFAANDLVNFIGVPMAGYNAYGVAAEAEAAGLNPLTVTMGDLGKTPTEGYLLLFAGAIMVVTLWLSKKAKTVTETEIRLGRQDEGLERFESIFLARVIVRMVSSLFETARRFIPAPIRSAIARRLDARRYGTMNRPDIDKESGKDDGPSFDLLRAAVNLSVAAMVISYATSYKLPLSTTYVTFMVAMGTSFADQAWGRESAVYRVTGVLAVVGGWFATAFTAFTVAFIFAFVIYFGNVFGVAALLVAAVFIIWRNHHKHIERATSAEMDEIFNLKKVTDLDETRETSFTHMSYLLREIRVSIDAATKALFEQNYYVLRSERAKARRIQVWGNIIVANIFKTMRLMQQCDAPTCTRFGQTIRRIQKLVDGHRDIIIRSHLHVSSSHKELLDVQIEELKRVATLLNDIFTDVEAMLTGDKPADIAAIEAKVAQMRALSEELHLLQLERVQDGTSKTRLTILYYAIVGGAVMLSKQNLKILTIYQEATSGSQSSDEYDME